MYFENWLNGFYKLKVPAERLKLNTSIFNTQTLKYLVQTPKYIKLSVKNQKQETLLGMN